jgi:hypothetical protein
VRHVYRVLQQRRGRSWKTVGVKTLPVDRRGGFRNAFKPDAAGTYRYYAEARRSATNALSRSRKAPLHVGSTRGGGARSARR